MSPLCLLDNKAAHIQRAQARLPRKARSKEAYTDVRNSGGGLKKLARVTSKGQVTVPIKIRRALGIRPGDVLLFEQDKASISVRAVNTKSPFAKYRGIGNRGMGSGRTAINRWIREMRGR